VSLLRGVDFEVRDYLLSGAGATAVVLECRATESPGCREHLYSVPVDGGSEISMAEQDDFEAVFTHLKSSTTDEVSFLSDFETDDVVELWLASTSGGMEKISGSSVPFADVTDYRSHGHPVFFFVADRDVDGRTELYGVSVEGGGAQKLNGPLAAGTQIGSIRDTPYHQRISYIANEGGLGDELRAVDFDGGNPELWSRRPPSVTSVTVAPLLPRSNYNSEFALFQATTCVSDPAPACTETIEARIFISDFTLPIFEAEPGQLAIVPESETFKRALFTHGAPPASELYLGDICILCDSFEAGNAALWSQTPP
jgi:hypothetical protein